MHRPTFALFLTALCFLPLKSRADDDAFTQSSFQAYEPQIWYISDGWANGDYQSCEWLKNALAYEDGRLKITLSDKGGTHRPIGCGEVRTKKRFGYGLYEARMRAASGSGLNSAFFTYVGPPQGVKEWDEIDFEFLGKDTHSVSLTYYANGKALSGKVISLSYDASKEFHDYAFDWEQDKITWYIDGREVHHSEPGAAIPHNPGAIFLTLWSGAAQEDNWLGKFDYTHPATAEFAWVNYTAPNVECSFPISMKCRSTK